MRTDWAVIFDVDGVLLELTKDLEELFFKPIESRLRGKRFSRDWNSYRIRNEEDIMKEISRGSGLRAADLAGEYLAMLRAKLNTRDVESQIVPGAKYLIDYLAGKVQLGIATANFREAAKMRLKQVALWQPVSKLAFGADGGGHKAKILARAVEATGLAPAKIIFVGDNVQDVEAGLKNKVHFIGFSKKRTRLAKLRKAGAKFTTESHSETLRLIGTIMD